MFSNRRCLPFGGLDYVTYLCCANCYNLYSLIYDEFWTNFLRLGARGFCARWKAGCLSIQAAGPGDEVFRGTGGPGGGGHFCSVVFDFSEILAVLVKRRFYGSEKFRILRLV